MKINLTLLHPTAVREVTLTWPAGLRIPVANERLLYGRTGPDSLAGFSITGLVTAITWVVRPGDPDGQPTAELVEVDMVVRVDP